MIISTIFPIAFPLGNSPNLKGFPVISTPSAPVELSRYEIRFSDASIFLNSAEFQVEFILIDFRLMFLRRKRTTFDVRWTPKDVKCSFISLSPSKQRSSDTFGRPSYDDFHPIWLISAYFGSKISISLFAKLFQYVTIQ